MSTTTIFVIVGAIYSVAIIAAAVVLLRGRVRRARSQRTAGQRRFRGALLVSAVFHTFAALALSGFVLALIGVGLALLDRHRDTDSGSVAAAFAVVAASSLLWTCFLKFFAYVLELLVDIYDGITRSASPG